MAGYLSTDPHAGLAAPPTTATVTTGQFGTVNAPTWAQYQSQSSVRPTLPPSPGATGSPSGLPTLASLGATGSSSGTSGTPGVTGAGTTAPTPGTTGGALAPAQVGEQRLVNGQLATWDGQGWRVN